VPSFCSFYLAVISMPAAGPAKKRASVKSAAKATAKPAAKPAAQAPSHAAATVVTKPAAKPATKPVKRSQQQASKAEREAKDKQEAQKALVTTAKDELLRFQKDAASKKAAAQQADSKKAAKSYAQAAEARKKNASKAEQELHNKKAQILLKTLRQMAEARTPGLLTCVSPADGQLNSTVSAVRIALLISLS
jgi:hypothetical protein